MSITYITSPFSTMSYRGEKKTSCCYETLEEAKGILEHFGSADETWTILELDVNAATLLGQWECIQKKWRKLV